MSRSPLLASGAPPVVSPSRGDGPEPASGSPATAARPLPLSHGQRALWFLDRLAPGSGAYVIAAAGRVVGPVDTEALGEAFRRLVERHPALRTTFHEVDSEPVRGVADRGSARMERTDARGWSEQELEQAVGEVAYRPFDLERGPLVRLAHFARGPGEDRLVLAIHHLVSDLWSLAVLLRELGTLYDGERGAGEEAPELPPLEATFEDLLERQEERLAGEDGERLWSFWERELSDRPESLDLPADHRRPASRRQRGAAEPFRLEPALWKRLRKTGRRHGANPFVTALAGLQALLHRLAGQDDLLVGTPTAGRREGDVSDLVAYCVNPVVVRTDASGDPPFGELLERVRDAGKRSFEHQDLPFPLLVERLEAGRDASRPPIFQVLFSLQRSRLGVGEGMSGFALGAPGARLELGSLVIESVPLEPRGAQFDLTVFTAEIEGALWGSLVYDRDLFDRTTVRRMAGQLRRLLAEVAEAPERRLSELSLLSPTERQQLLTEWNDTAPVPDGDLPGRLDARFRAQAARTPDAVALVDVAGERLRFDALARRVTALAGRLRAAGVGPEVRVGVCLPRRAEMVVALLAVLEAGGAYVPLDAAYPEERLAFMLEDAGAPVVLASPETRERLPLDRLPAPPEVIDPADEEDGAPPAPAAADPPADDESLAYLIYTSGSTGRPKGVAIPHRAACALLDWAAGVFSARELAGVLAGTSICFDLSVFELFLPLTTGGRVVLADDALGAAAHADTGEVTLLNTVPSAMKELVAAGTLPKSLRTVNLAGEPLQRALVDGIYRSRPRVERVYNLYGPSEDTTYSTAARIDRGATGEPTIGAPIAGSRAYVLDRNLRPAPVGVPGELCLAGAGLARGYLGRPARTAASFVPDPFAAPELSGAGGVDNQGGRLYRTGDLVRRRTDGALEFLGRLDHQVKIRGFRIELGEIEAALVAHPAVAEAVVVARKRPEGGEAMLVAYVAPAEEGAAGSLADPLRSHLGARLPAYMVPAAFVELEALPLTPNGKVDRKALPAPVLGDGAGDGAAEAPRGATEERLAALYAEVLALPGDRPVGREEDFFRLGGHSLLATRLASRIHEAVAVRLPIAALFEAPTVAALARRIDADLADRADAEDRADAPEPIPRRSDPATAPLSFAQERLWFLARLDPHAASYNMPGAVRMTGRLSLSALDGALGDLMARHEALRTEIVDDGEDSSGPHQRILPAGSVAGTLPVIDLTGLPASRRDAAANRLAEAQARRPVSLAHAPLLRTTLVRTAPDEHVFALVMHHVISDGWSLGVFVQELAASYGARVHNQERGRESGRAPDWMPDLAPLPIQYGDFALWQRTRLTDAVRDDLLAWWRNHLHGAPTVLALPTDRPRPLAPTGAGGVVRIPLPQRLTERLEALGRERGATLFMVLLAAFGALLGRTASREDLVLGTPNAGRDRRELEGLIGLFVETVALRFKLDRSPTLAELVDRARETSLSSFAHQQLPFDRLVEALVPERGRGVPPLVQVMLALQNAPMGPLELPGLRLERIAADTGAAKFDLGVSFEPFADSGNQGLLGVWSFTTDLFDATTVRRMAAHLQGILETLVEDPERPVHALPLLTAAERHEVFVEWNDEPWPVAPAGACLHHLIERWAGRTPDAVAVVFEDRQLTYGALLHRARVVADALRRRGAGPETLVGLCTERSIEQVVGVLGILEAGAAYVPLDPTYPPERLEVMIAEAGLRQVVTQHRVGSSLEGMEVERLWLDDLPAKTSVDGPVTARPRAPAAEPTPDNAVYAIFTSGSTGRPKGVVATHRSVSNRLLYAAGHDPVGHGAGLLKASICFDLSVLELFSPLVAGTRLVLARPDGHGDMAYLLDLIARERVTQSSFLPSQLSVLMEQDDLDRLASMEGVMTGGEAVPPTLPARFAERTGLPLFNRYGPTETTLSVTSWRCDAEREVATIPIGRRIGGASIYLLGPGLLPMPAPVPGELCIGGVCVTRGYLHRPKLTAQTFVPDPFATEPGGRLYRSGDLARWRADGVVEFLGRIDQQVKIRGYRIELGEIEAVLVQHPGVLEATVIDCDEPGTEHRRLAAYVVAAPEAAPEPADLRAFVEAKLPAYMVPAAFERLDELPLTTSGKVDRRRLPEPTWDAGHRREYVAPRTPAEERLAGLFAEVLDVERVGAEDDFFDLGGHSLLATRLVSRVRAAFGVELPLRRLFETPTVAGLASALEGEAAPGDPGTAAGAPPLGAAAGTGPWPASFAQERLWFLARLDPASAAYHMPGAVRIDGALSPEVLAGALTDVVRRHATLRTVFEETREGVLQHVHRARPVALPVIDLGALPTERRRAVAQRLARAVAAVPFDLERDPLLRVALVRLAPAEHLVALSMHHIASDGWSVGVLIRELAACYRARHEAPHGDGGAAAALPALPVQYTDFAVWQRAWLRGEALERRLDWWRTLLDGAPAALELPLDRPRPPVQTFRGGELRTDLGAASGTGIERLARHLDVTPFMVLLAAVATLLGRFGRQNDVVLGSPIAGRTREELEGLIGLFVNTLALRVDLSGDPSFAELVGRVKAMALGAFAHQDLPFERLVEAVAPVRNLSSTPLFQVLFAFQNAPRERLEMAGATLEPQALPATAAKFDLTVDLGRQGDRISARLEYNRDLFDATTVRRLGSHLATLLEAAAAAPETPLSRLRVLGAAERHLLHAEWSDSGALPATRPGAPGATCLPRLVLDQAQRTPEAEALLAGTERWTYRELTARSGAIAARLRAAGVGPEVRVGVFAERSPALVAALLGVLRAGGTYVPLDPAYPPERVAFMLEDSAAAVVLTDAALADRLPVADLAEPPAVLALDDLLTPEALAAAGTEIPDGSSAGGEPPIDPRRLAYLIYTSGSTGRPKGVAISHGAAAAMVRWAGTVFPAEALAGVLAATSVCFDLSVYELFVPLAHGGKLILARDALELPALAEGGEIRLVNTVPSVMRELLAASELPTSVRVVNLAGEPLKRALADTVYERSPGLQGLYNLYGPSEDTTYSTAAAVPRRVDGQAVEPTIGRPIAGSRAYVVDPAGPPDALAPIGVPGELCLAGAGLARGYLGRPARTAQSFVPDPFGSASNGGGGRLYRTGDLVRWRRDGELEFLGRLDHQVKVRGFRIELGEIEAALASHPAVAEAVAAVYETPDRAEADRAARDLVAYLVPAQSGAAGADDEDPLAGRARAWLQKRLPGYMVPAHFVELAELPRTPSGKIDRKALPAPGLDRAAAGPGYEPPETELEEALAEAWSEVLGVERIGIHDDFFALGGHSLKATQILLRVRDDFGVELPVRRFFEDPTIAGLSVAVVEALLAEADDEDVAEALDDEDD